MLKFVFVCLLVVNGALAAFQLGWLDGLLRGGHEPERLRNQINADKVRILSPVQGASAPPVSVAAGSSGASGGSGVAGASGVSTSAVPNQNTTRPADPAPGKPAPLTPVMAGPGLAQNSAACIEVGNLTLAEGKRFEARLASLTLAPTPLRRESREESSHMVWIPPPPTGKEGADKKSAELRKLGIRDFYVLQDTPARHGISLGVFKTEDAAKAHLARLAELGVRSARVVEHRMPLVRIAFQFAAIGAESRQSVDKLRTEFPRHELRQCSA